MTKLPEEIKILLDKLSVELVTVGGHIMADDVQNLAKEAKQSRRELEKVILKFIK